MAKTSKKTTSSGKDTVIKRLVAAVEKARAALRVAEAALEEFDLAALTSDERAHSSGKLREGESDMLTIVLDTVDAHPQQFASLAPHDHGTDDRVVETGPARAALARRNLLAPLAMDLAALSLRVSDDVLAAGALARDVTTPAYAIIRANAPLNAALRKSAARPLSFYVKQAQKKPTAKKTTTAASA
jgi:hypothetical protein